MTRPTTEDDLAMRRSEHDAYEDMARRSEKLRLPSGLSLESDAHTRHHVQASSQWQSAPGCRGLSCDQGRRPCTERCGAEMGVGTDDEAPLPWWTPYGLVAGFVAAAALVVVAAFAGGYVLQRYLPPDWLAFLFGP